MLFTLFGKKSTFFFDFFSNTFYTGTTVTSTPGIYPLSE